MSDAHEHAADHSGGHDHPPHLAHHFETPEQQMESGKLGMWVFLATEILMFGGLFCAYAVYRGNHPDVFLFAHQFLDTKWGAINTAVLLASSFTMAWGVRAAQLGQKRLLVTMLALTLLGGLGFMTIKSVEYTGKHAHGLWVGPVNAFYQSGGVLANADNFKEADKYLDKKKAEKYGKTGGHGDHDHGHGDGAHDADHSEGEHHTEAHADDHGEDAHAQAEAEPADEATPDPEAEIVLTNIVPTQIARPAASQGGVISGLIQNPVRGVEGGRSLYTGVGAAQATHQGSHYPDYDELAARDKLTTSTFFQIYYVMTGLHGIHVVIGMALIGWILWMSGGPWTKALVGPVASIAFAGFLVFVGFLTEGFPAWLVVSIGLSVVIGFAAGVLNVVKLGSFSAGAFSPEYYTPVDLVGLYWHLVDLIWIFLFPLLYLIH